MSRDRVAAGLYWEQAASEYLARHGIRTLLKRYRCRVGELDLVCTDGSVLIIVEVRARSSNGYVSALASVDQRKRRRIVNATRHLLLRHPEWRRHDLRFDVVAIEGIESGKPQLEWIRAAFDAG